MSMKLYVGNLSFQTSSFDLEELFAGIGTVESASVVEDRETGRSRGFGVVEMANQADGEKAVAAVVDAAATAAVAAATTAAAEIAGKPGLNIETRNARRLIGLRAFSLFWIS